MNDEASLNMQGGFCVLPINFGELLTQFTAHIPPLLASQNPVASHSYFDEHSISKPLSAMAVQIFVDSVNATLSRYGGSTLHSESESKDCLHDIIKISDQLLIGSIKKLQAEVDDIAYYGQQTIKDWISTTTLTSD